jgi:hypothetical protein
MFPLGLPLGSAGRVKSRLRRARTVRRWAGSGSGEQYKELLERQLPENLKLLIAKQIENNIFAKVRAVLQPAGAGK